VEKTFVVFVARKMVCNAILRKKKQFS